jgi:putative membrane protein
MRMSGFVLAAVHLMSLPLGVLSLTQRARALAAAERDEHLKPVFFWDGAYGLVAIVWLGSGLWRAFGGVEKGGDYYLSNHVFWTKMLLLGILLVLEGYLAVTFVRWRIRLKKNEPVSLAHKARLVRFHYAEFWVIVAMVAMATLMARGIGVVKAAPKAPALETVDARAAAELATGERVYRRYCVTCHQFDGRGQNGKLAADFRGDPKRLAKSDTELRTIVAHGVPGTAMRAFGAELDALEVGSVVRYIRARFGPNAPP